MKIGPLTNIPVILEEGDLIAIDEHGYLFITSDGVAYKSVNPLESGGDIPDTMCVNSVGPTANLDNLGWRKYSSDDSGLDQT